jgi:hypothetical protein
MGASMTAISLRQSARRSQLDRTATAVAIEVGQFSNDGGKNLIDPARLRDRFAAGNVTLRSREFAGGFVDFLLGRGPCHSR